MDQLHGGGDEQQQQIGDLEIFMKKVSAQSFVIEGKSFAGSLFIQSDQLLLRKNTFMKEEDLGGIRTCD